MDTLDSVESVIVFSRTTINCLFALVGSSIVCSVLLFLVQQRFPTGSGFGEARSSRPLFGCVPIDSETSGTGFRLTVCLFGQSWARDCVGRGLVGHWVISAADFNVIRFFYGLYGLCSSVGWVQGVCLSFCVRQLRGSLLFGPSGGIGKRKCLAWRGYFGRIEHDDILCQCW